MSRLDDITNQRLDKLKKLREDKQLNPYPQRYHRSHTTKEAITLFEQGQEAEVSLAGRIVAIRGMGKAVFMDMRDASGKIQLYLGKGHLSEDKVEFVKLFDIGDFIGASGKVFKTRTGEITLEVHNLTMLAKSLQPLPEKWHGLQDVEKRYRQRYLDLVSSEEVRNIFLVRSRIVSSVRRFMGERGFIEVETPVLHSVPGGARAHPFTTHHNALNEDLYLRIALELYLKRLIVGGFEKVFEIGRVFRNEGISTKHNPEFTMMESYEAYADYNDVMKMLEEMVAKVAIDVIGTTEVKFGEHVIDFKPPWKRMSLRDAVKNECGIDFLEHGDSQSLREAIKAKGLQTEETLSPAYLIDKLVSEYVEPKLIQPTFLYDYPAETSPLAKCKEGDNRLVERFEAFVSGIEIANAFTELNDPQEQAARFNLQEEWRVKFGDQEAERYQEDFITALEHGMPPTGGLGVGIDRLVMLLTGQQSIREVILFPQLKSK